jgi:hypothetical protein
MARLPIRCGLAFAVLALLTACAADRDASEPVEVSAAPAPDETAHIRAPAPGAEPRPFAQEASRVASAPVRSLRLRGRFVDEEGRAIAGARVEANVTFVADVGSGVEPRTTEHVVQTDDDGRYELDVPRAESDTKVYVALFANAGSAGSTRSSQARALADVVELSTLVCVSDEPSVIVEGTVVDDFGVPCAYCRVVEMTNVTNGEPKRRRPDNGAVTDEAGRFRIATFPGSFGLTASGPDGRFTLGEDVEARRGDHVTGIVITLPAPRGPTSISGRVLDAQRTPVADARVLYDFRQAPFGGSDTTSEAGGEFRIDAWKLSTVHVWAIDPRSGAFSEARVLPTGLHDVELVLDSKSTVDVNIVDATGEPAPVIEWELHPEDLRVPPRSGAATLEAGTFTCPVYPGDLVRLVVRSRATGAHAEWTGWTAGMPFTLTLTR